MVGNSVLLIGHRDYCSQIDSEFFRRDSELRQVLMTCRKFFN